MRLHPTTMELELVLVATDQNMIGNAAAFEIKNQMFEIAKNLKKTICLETSIPRVRRLYKLSGYTAVSYTHLTLPTILLV